MEVINIDFKEVRTKAHSIMEMIDKMDDRTHLTLSLTILEADKTYKVNMTKRNVKWLIKILKRRLR